MSYLLAAPESLAAAATDVNGIAAAVHAANAAAAGQTSGVLAAAEDEVSAAIANLFSVHGNEYQAVVKQVAAFESEFTAALSAAAQTYTQAEALNGALLNGFQSLLGQPATAAAPAATVALIMGGTNNPLPIVEYIDDIYDNYIRPQFGAIPRIGVFTPEQFWPVTPGLGTLTYGQSVAKGVALLNTAINQQLAMNNSVVSFGYSQSASIVNNEILNLMAAGSPHVND